MRETFNFGTDFFALDMLSIIYDKTIGKIQIVASKIFGNKELVMIEFNEMDSKHTVKPLKVKNKSKVGNIYNDQIRFDKNFLIFGKD